MALPLLLGVLSRSPLTSLRGRGEHATDRQLFSPTCHALLHSNCPEARACPSLTSDQSLCSRPKHAAPLYYGAWRVRQSNAQRALIN